VSDAYPLWSSCLAGGSAYDDAPIITAHAHRPMTEKERTSGGMRDSRLISHADLIHFLVDGPDGVQHGWPRETHHHE
jgi:hypothetical protein